MEVFDAKDRQEWDDFITSHSEANFLQSWDFYEFYKSRGNKVVRRIVKADDRIVGAYAGVVEDAKRGRYLAVAGGPIVDWGKHEALEMLFQDMRAEGKNINVYSYACDRSWSCRRRMLIW